MSHATAAHDNSPSDHLSLMDRIYRVQRHIYDITRKFYLLGRDRLLADLPVQQGDAVLEVGCGTARNLVVLHKLKKRAQPKLTFTMAGLDASEEMLKTASKNASRAGLHVPLVRVLAEQLDAKAQFNREKPFDVIFFSYALSMIPTWKESIDAASRNLKPGAAIHIVDFCDQADLPRWFAGLLKWWLSLFHVAHKPELLAYLQELDRTGRGKLKLTFLYGRYCYLAEFTPTHR